MEDHPVESSSGGKRQGLWRPIVLVAAIVVVLVLAKAFGLGDRLGDLKGWIHSYGAWAPLIFVAIYSIATVFSVPGSALTIAAGALFGSVMGVVSVIFGATIGASLAFLVSRYFARGAVAGWLQDKPTFQKLDRLTEEHGAIIVALTRLVPIFPFNLLNYGFGLTRVRFGTYVLWSFVCMLPGTVLYVVGTDAIASGLSEGRVPWGLIGVFAAAVIGVSLLVRYARRSLRFREAGAVKTEGSGNA